MFFTCPKCNTVYDVPADRADNARKLRCSVCGHRWESEIDIPDSEETEIEESQKQQEQQELPPPPDDFSFDDENEPLPRFPDPPEPEPDFSSFKPIFQEPEKQSTAVKWIRPLYFFSMLCLAVGIYTFFFHTPNKFPLVFQSLSPEYTEKDYQTSLFLNAVIHNESAGSVTVNSFKVIFYDEKGKEITVSELPAQDQIFEAGEIKPVRLEVGRPPAKAAKAVLEIFDVTP